MAVYLFITILEKKWKHNKRFFVRNESCLSLSAGCLVCLGGTPDICHTSEAHHSIQLIFHIIHSAKPKYRHTNTNTDTQIQIQTRIQKYKYIYKYKNPTTNIKTPDICPTSAAHHSIQALARDFHINANIITNDFGSDQTISLSLSCSYLLHNIMSALRWLSTSPYRIVCMINDYMT